MLQASSRMSTQRLSSTLPMGKAMVNHVKTTSPGLMEKLVKESKASLVDQDQEWKKTALAERERKAHFEKWLENYKKKENEKLKHRALLEAKREKQRKELQAKHEEAEKSYQKWLESKDLERKQKAQPLTDEVLG